MLACFDRGTEVAIHYPLSTHVRFWRPDEYRRREVVIDSVRDLVAQPLTVDEFLRRPFLLRSRWLVRAYEPRLRQWRQFYWGSTREFAAPGILRVGLYEPGATEASWVHGRVFHPTPADRRELMQLLKQWDKTNFGDLSLKVFADDLPETADPDRCKSPAWGSPCAAERRGDAKSCGVAPSTRSHTRTGERHEQTAEHAGQVPVPGNG